MKQIDNTIYADEGKVLKYKNSDTFFGNVVYLGYRLMMDGSIIYDTILDFDEVDEITDNDLNIEEI